MNISRKNQGYQDDTRQITFLGIYYRFKNNKISRIFFRKLEIGKGKLYGFIYKKTKSNTFDIRTFFSPCCNEGQII